MRVRVASASNTEPTARVVSRAVVCLVAVLTGLAPIAARATTLPAGFVETRVVFPVTLPTAMAIAPDGRVFVAEKFGNLRVVKDGVLLTQPFLTVVADHAGERGLLGVAVDPQFSSNHYIYIYYTATTPTIHNRVSRFTASGDVAVPGSETVLLDVDPLTASGTHNAGGLHFGPDGMLYVAVGDNGDASNAQSMSTLKGKILRINPDGTIPTSNPFYGTASGVNRAIWALGVRNPFTFDFQPGSGRMFINDVGQDFWEEINDGAAGANYGWPDTEGYTSDPRFSSPVFAYPHTGLDNLSIGCAITGGTFYNPTAPQFPNEYVGKYFFMDYCNRWISVLDPADNSVAPFASNLPVFSVNVTAAPDGSLYYLRYDDGTGAGALYRIQYTGTLAPTIGTQPESQIASVGYTATFTVAASGYEPLHYQWQLNGVDIPGATSPEYTTAPVSLSDSGGQYRCIVSNDFGTATSDAAILTVTTDKPPVPTITAPAVAALYGAGDTIAFAGTADDPETGALPPSAFTWRVDFQHSAHAHPFIPATTGITGGTFTIPIIGETSPDVWYRIYLTVIDSAGLKVTTYRDIRPRKSTMTLASNPLGLLITLDGQPRTAPTSAVGVVNLTRSLGVVSPQTVNGIIYEFVSWSDGGAATHNISTQVTDATYTATFRSVGNGSISASPNPIQVCDGTGLGVTTITWNSSGVTAAEVHVNSPTGPLFASLGPGLHTWTTNKWVFNGMTFYLQDVSGGKPLTTDNTLATVTVGVTAVGCPVMQIVASPNPIQVCDGSGQGTTTVSWTPIAGVTSVQVHLNSPTGALFSTVGPNGSATTGKWVSEGMVFYLQNVTGGLPLTAENTLGTVTMHLTTTGCPRSGSISASPNPVRICDGTGLGETMITWNSSGVSATEVHVNSLTGPLFAALGSGPHTWPTGKWVQNGMTFYLQDVSGGLPLTSANTLATAVVDVTQNGCLMPTLTWNNPADIAYGTALGATQLNATANAPGTFAYSPLAGTVLNAGVQALSTTFTPTDATTYTTASKSVSLTVAKATPILGWADPADIVYGTPLSGIQLNATTNVPGTFAYTPAANTVLNAGVQILSVTFTPTDSANYTQCSKSVSIKVAKGTPTLVWNNPADSVYGTSLSALQLNAAASVPGTLAYSPPAGTVLNAGTGILSVTFTPTDTTNYAAASKTVSLNVSRAPLTIRADDKTKVFGAPLPSFTATPSGFVNGDTMASLGGTLTLTTAATAASPVGTYAVTPGGVTSTNYMISFASGTLTITKAATSNALVSSPNPSNRRRPITLTSTLSVLAPGSGVPTGTVDFLDGSTLLGSGSLTNNSGSFTASFTTSGLAQGTHVLSARYQGDASFTGSTSPTVSQVVKK